MAVVVSDTTPLHYLILIRQESILETLYGHVLVPPAVLDELEHPGAPAEISRWAAEPPAWLSVETPRQIRTEFGSLGLGERQALALAKERSADWVLVDDKEARRMAKRDGLRVKGTLGILAEAGRSELLDFVQALEALRQTNARLHPDTITRAIEDYQQALRQEKRHGREQ